jgi:4-hydroxy-tetrahydrodipicolinate synthase
MAMFEGTLVALVTPMHEDGSIDIASLQKLVKSQAAQPIQGLVLVGSTGESSTLTVAEKLETVQIALDAAQGQVPIIAASNDNETNRTIALTRQFSELGVAGVLISSPAYSRPTQRGLAAHFQKIKAF